MNNDMLMPFLHRPIIIVAPGEGEVPGVLPSYDSSLNLVFGTLASRQVIIIKQRSVINQLDRTVKG
jgi:small nuclear ribonucleoprotein (snRNP)-like protein